MSSSALARTLVATLLAQGVRHVVLAPGSRNAPLALALATADEAGQLDLVVRVDERSAGFVALGIAKVTGTPVPVVTTSGTAVGNLLPAVMEARHAGVPLLVLSADRPTSMIDSGANQTTNQQRLFGDHAVATLAMSSQSGGPADWRHAVRRAVALAAAGGPGGQPGPVQLNIALAAPLVDPVLMEPVEPEVPLLVERAGAAGALSLEPSPRTVVLAGDGTRETGAAAVEAARALGAPLLAEPSSHARHSSAAIGTYRLLLPRFAPRIERVVVFGRPTLSRPVTALLGRQDVELIMVGAGEWIDPGHAASRVVGAITCARPGDGDWLDDWRTADGALTAAVDAQDPPDNHRLGPREATLAIWSTLTSDDLVMLGSSNPIRDADLAPISHEWPEVYANRGLSGIDGTLSTAVGLALGAGRPVTAIVGDLTAVHDLTGLAFGDHEKRPDLRVVVLDDHGGSIFRSLEQGAETYERHFSRVFGTPQDVDLELAALGMRATARSVHTADELREALAGAPRGVEVVVVEIARSDRELR